MKIVGIFTWLFTGKKSDESDDAAETAAGSAEDYEEFINYLRSKDRAFSKPGRSVKEEFKFWQADRVKKQAAGYSSPAGQFAAFVQK
jgi:hypothetical protein